jgi:hypothetical protein
MLFLTHKKFPNVFLADRAAKDEFDNTLKAILPLSDNRKTLSPP